MDTYKIENMFPGELDEYLNSGQDRAVLPVGSIEQHGPHLLLGCDSYVAKMLADYTAQYSNSILFPLVPFSWIGGLRVWPGTIDIRSRNMGNYLEEVCLNIVEMGFKKLLLINCHGGGRIKVFSVARNVFKKTGIPIIGMFPWADTELSSIWNKYGIDDSGAHEACSMMGGLKKEGKEEILNKVKKFTEKALKEFGDKEVGKPASAKKASKMGEIGHDYLEETRHVTPKENVSADAGIAYNKAMAEELAELMDELEEYHDQIGI